MKDMAQLYLADEDAEDVDGRCLELRTLWLADDRYQLTGLLGDEVLGVTVGVVGLSLTSAMDEILLFLGAS